MLMGDEGGANAEYWESALRWLRVPFLIYSPFVRWSRWECSHITYPKEGAHIKGREDFARFWNNSKEQDFKFIRQLSLSAFNANQNAKGLSVDFQRPTGKGNSKGLGIQGILKYLNLVTSSASRCAVDLDSNLMQSSAKNLHSFLQVTYQHVCSKSSKLQTFSSIHGITHWHRMLEDQ